MVRAQVSRRGPAGGSGRGERPPAGRRGSRLRGPARGRVRVRVRFPRLGGSGPREGRVRGQERNVSFRVTVPEAGTVAVRFAPDSQVTFPAASLRTYLYSKDVPAGSVTASFQTG